MRNKMSLFMYVLSHLLNNEGSEAMLIGDMDIIARLMINVQQVKEDKLKKRDEFQNKRARTSNHEFNQ